MNKYNILKNNISEIPFSIISGFFLSLMISWIPTIAWKIIDSIIFILPNISWFQFTAVIWIILTITIFRKNII